MNQTNSPLSTLSLLAPVILFVIAMLMAIGASKAFAASSVVPLTSAPTSSQNKTLNFFQASLEGSTKAQFSLPTNTPNSITYSVQGTENVSLDCYASDGTLVNIASLSLASVGTIVASDLQNDTSACATPMKSLQDLRNGIQEGAIYLFNGTMAIQVEPTSAPR